MKLINATTLKIKSFHDSVQVPYAILSHTWEGDEVTFEDMQDLAMARKKTTSFSKIKETCRIALLSHLHYVWVDTCCVDKSSSAELSEAINSMFRWYRDAANCRWFSRGWTLQELIAPTNVVFYDAEWNWLGTKHGAAENLHAITGIDKEVQEETKPLTNTALARRMSWAATRKTTRVEDVAYCLLGIFDVNMPMLYGEGPRAFARLQQEILRESTDLSLFAWRSNEESATRGILA
ncbi:hypothetical protein QQX98_012947 [Neonectria punicea]|uniref:Heterokaryon incompatibility domain-containing protein n=1 Tax=Neonectria punicea TaxID=979145 RepID=A0ABR1GHP9_9HYPO